MKPDHDTLQRLRRFRHSQTDLWLHAALNTKINTDAARVERISRMALKASVTSMEAHAAALGRAEYPGPGWWEISHIQHRWGCPSRVVMRYRLPLRYDAKRAAEPSA